MTPLAVWAGYWLLAALLFLLPANRAATSVSGAITGMAPGEPPWYASFLNHVGHWFGSAGLTQTWLLALLAVVVGIGPLLFRRFEGFLAVGFVATDPVLADRSGSRWRPDGIGDGPEHRAARGRPGARHGAHGRAQPDGGCHRRSGSSAACRLSLRRRRIGAFCALLLAATYPAAAAAPAAHPGRCRACRHVRASTSTSGMSDMTGMMPASQTAGTASCTQHCGPPRARPHQLARHGHGISARHHHEHERRRRQRRRRSQRHDGQLVLHRLPPCRQQLADELLTDGENGPDDVHMASSGCAPEPTFSQEIGAFSYVRPPVTPRPSSPRRPVPWPAATSRSRPPTTPSPTT